MEPSNKNAVSITRFDLKSHWVLLLLIGLVALIVVVSWTEFLDKNSSAYSDQALTRSLLAYAAGRTLNGVVSVAQSTAFSFNALGGVSVTAGEIVDPINDLVEQYSTLMKFSIGSLMIQQVLLEIVSHGLFSIAMTISGVGLIGSLLLKGNPLLAVAARTFVFIVFLRFILVLVVLLNSVVSHVFIQEKTEADVDHIEVLSSEMSETIETSEMDQQTRDSAAEALIDLRERRDSLLAQIQQLEEPLQSAIQLLQVAEDALSEARSEAGFLDGWFGDDPQVESAVQERDIARDELGGIQTQYDDLTAQLNQAQMEIARNENIIAGRPNSITERVQGQWEGMVNVVDPRTLGERFDEAIKDIIRIMSLFVFETMILPLIFLYMLLKGMNRIWGIDMAGLIGSSGSAGWRRDARPQKAAITE